MRGRHNKISIITRVQKVSTVPPVIRVYATHLFFFKVRTFKGLKLLQDELSAVVRSNNLHENQKLIYQLYEIATQEWTHKKCLWVISTSICRYKINNIIPIQHDSTKL